MKLSIGNSNDVQQAVKEIKVYRSVWSQTKDKDWQVSVQMKAKAIKSGCNHPEKQWLQKNQDKLLRQLYIQKEGTLMPVTALFILYHPGRHS
jgi:Leu/Phe-tRNA-protein transferase